MTFDEYSVDLLFKERQAVHARLAELHGRGMAVVQSMILIIGTGVLAATQEPGAFVIAPIIWSVWLLYAQQIDRESMKYSVYGEWLEKQHDDRLAKLGGVPMTSPRAELFRAQPGRWERGLYVFPGLYAFALQVVLTWVGFLLLWREGRRELAWLFLGWMALTAILVAGLTAVRPKTRRRYEQITAAYPAPPSAPDAVEVAPVVGGEAP